MHVDHLTYQHSRNDFNRLTLTPFPEYKAELIKGKHLNIYVPIGYDPIHIIREARKTKTIAAMRIFYVPKHWLEKETNERVD